MSARLRHWLRRGVEPFRLAWDAGWDLDRRQAEKRHAEKLRRGGAA